MRGASRKLQLLHMLSLPMLYAADHFLQAHQKASRPAAGTLKGTRKGLSCCSELAPEQYKTSVCTMMASAAWKMQDDLHLVAEQLTASRAADQTHLRTPVMPDNRPAKTKACTAGEAQSVAETVFQREAEKNVQSALIAKICLPQNFICRPCP